MSAGPVYTLDDPRRNAAEAPYTYLLPSPAELAALEPDDLVQLVFRPRLLGEKWDAERMWVTVEAVDGEAVTGRLASEPDDIVGLQAGEPVTFQRHHVIAVLWSETRATPPPARLIRREFWDRCLVDRCVIDEKLPIHYLYREEPEITAEGDRYPDGGWRIRGDYRGLSDEEIAAREVEYVAIGRVLNVDDSWLHLIDAPVGCAFIRDWDTGEFEDDLG